MINAINVMTKESLASAKPTAKSKPGFRLMEHLRFVEQSADRTVVEFIGTNTISNTTSLHHPVHLRPSWTQSCNMSESR